MNIIHIYRKITEKSRHLAASALHLHSGRWQGVSFIDRFLFIAAIVLCLGFICFSLFLKGAGTFGRTELPVSRQCADLFGGDTMDMLIREFEDRNPELRIKLEAENPAGAKGRSSPPGIVFFDEGQYKRLIREGALGPLNSYMHTEAGTVQQAVPLVSYMDMLFYNIDILKAAGFDRPPKTQAEFLACAKKVSDNGNGIYGAAFGLSPGDPLAVSRDVFSWIWAEGESLWRPDSGEPFFKGKKTAELIAFLGQLYSEGALAPGTFDKTGADRLAEFAGGKIAMIIASSGAIPFLQEGMNGTLGITAMPGTAGPGKSGIGISGIYAGISGGYARPDEAWTFLAFLAEKSPVLAAKLKAVPGSLPGIFPGGAFPGDYINEELYSKAWDIFETSDIAEGFSGHPKGGEFEDIVREELTLFFRNNRSPADTAEAIQKRWDTLYALR